ncbi:MAG: tetratricopeptide repeat protein [Bacteroidales bacterium]|nr:tetratricopeptide repeat protein [Bacteroidales bacterium]
MKTLANLTCTFVILLGLPGISYSFASPYDQSSDNILVESASDSLRLITLFDSAKYYVRIDPILSKNLLQKLIYIGEQKNSSLLPEYYNIYGSANYFLGKYSDSKLYYEKSLKLYQQCKDTVEIIRLQNNLGYLFSVTGNYELSLEHYHQGLLLAETLYQGGRLPSISSQLGNKTADQLLNHLYANIGRIHARYNNYQDAINNYQRALESAEKAGNRYYYAYYLNELATLHTEIKEYEQALIFCNRAIEVNKEIDNRLGIGINYQTMGEIYARKDKIENAEIYLNKGLELIENEDDLPSKADALFSRIRIQLSTRQFLNVQQDLDECLDIAHNTGNIDILKNYHFYQFQLDSSRGKTESALENFVKYHNLQSTLLDIQKNKRINELQIAYESQRKEKELELLSKENEVQRVKLNKARNFVYFIIGAFTLILIIVYLLMQYQKLRIKHKVIELKQKNLNQQMNPHFVYNCLNSIQCYIFQNDTGRSMIYLSKFAKLMRRILQSSQHEYMSIHDETELLTLYLELESMRFKGKFDYNIKVDGKIDPDYYKIPTLLLQPFVENSLWHGIQNKTGKGHIDIEFRLINDLLLCSIEDDGIGRNKAALLKKEYHENHRSLGTHITQDRMRLLRELYGKKLDIRYIDLTNNNNLPAGTRVEINLPVLN